MSYQKIVLGRYFCKETQTKLYLRLGLVSIFMHLLAQSYFYNQAALNWTTSKKMLLAPMEKQLIIIYDVYGFNNIKLYN